MGRLLIGLGLVAVGAVLLGERAELWDSGEVFSTWWPLAIIAIGVVQLAGRPRPWLGAGIVVAIGVLLQLSQLDVLPGDTWDVLWPSILIAIGLWLVAGRLRRRAIPASPDATVNLFAVLGEANSASSSQAFTGGTVMAVLGGARLDLRGARPAPGGAEVEASVLFGGADILVPPGWDVQVSGLPILGGIDDKTRHDAPPTEGAPRLYVKGLALFGGVEVKHER